MKHVRELVELENGINFTGNAEVAIGLTEEELAAFIANINDFAKCAGCIWVTTFFPLKNRKILFRYIILKSISFPIIITGICRRV